MSKKKDSSTSHIDGIRIMLRGIFEKAIEKNEMIWPDEAFKQVTNTLENYYAANFNPDKPPFYRVHGKDFEREIHHNAVDLFYEFYYPSKSGASVIAKPYCDKLLSLAKTNMTRLEIAQEMEDLPLNTAEERERAKDTISKRIKLCRKREQ